MKLLIVLAIFVSCAYADTLKNELIQRAKSLDQKIKVEINKLKAQNREHLAVLLREEQTRLNELSAHLAKVADGDEVETSILETNLITLEYRVESEINILTRQSANQEFLVQNANILKHWVTEEIQVLEKTEPPYRAQEIARILRREEQRIEAMVQQLTKAQNQKQIERLEAELRAMEVRLYEALNKLHFIHSNQTNRHSTGSTRPASHTSARPVTRRLTTPRHATVRHTTTRPVTKRLTTPGHAIVRHTTTRPVTRKVSNPRHATVRHSTNTPRTTQPVPTQEPY